MVFIFLAYFTLYNGLQFNTMNCGVIEDSWESLGLPLPAKARLVKAMVFPVVMHGCESWTIKKAERRRIDAFKL